MMIAGQSIRSYLSDVKQNVDAWVVWEKPSVSDRYSPFSNTCSERTHRARAEPRHSTTSGSGIVRSVRCAVDSTDWPPERAHLAKTIASEVEGVADRA